jgi:hypothetical protein
MQFSCHAELLPFVPLGIIFKVILMRAGALIMLGAPTELWPFLLAAIWARDAITFCLKHIRGIAINHKRSVVNYSAVMLLGKTHFAPSVPY